MGEELKVEEFSDMVFTKFVGLEYDASKIYKLDNKPISFRKNQRFKEILSKCQLHASSFRELNDIDECRYVYSGNKNINEIMTDKEKRLICSFSYTESSILPNDNRDDEQDLMWAHYANSHCGAKIDFSIDISRLEIDSIRVFKVGYSDDRIIYDGSNLDDIMTTKKLCWEYENEYRAIIHTVNGEDNKLPIIIKKITLGKKFSNNFVGRRDNDPEEYEPHIRDIAEQIIEVYEKANPRYPIPMIVGYKSRYSNVCDKDILDKNYNNI